MTSGQSSYQQWTVVKASRSYNGGMGYMGPSWEAAGLAVPVEPFDTWDEALDAVNALYEVNHVGWRIVAYFGGDADSTPLR